jgi:PKD repeat protein
MPSIPRLFPIAVCACSIIIGMPASAQPVAGFLADRATVCSGEAVQFTDTSTGTITSWTWTFPGGEPGTWNGPSPPPVVFTIAGLQQVQLQVSDGLVSDVATFGLEVLASTPAPFAEDFNGGFFPPQGWSLAVDGVPEPTSWSADFFPACGQGTSIFVPGFNIQVDTAAPALTSPPIEMPGIPDPYLRFRRSYAPRSTTVTERLVVELRDCSGTVEQVVYDAAGTALATNGGQPVSTNWFPASCADWATTVIPLEEVPDGPVRLAFVLGTNGGQNVFLDDVEVFAGSRLHVRALLGGAYRAAAGLMVDSLRVQQLLPLTEPYSALGFQLMETLTGERGAGLGGSDALVDWVVVEVRAALDPTVVLTSRVALLQRDGDVVDLDGVSRVRVGVPEGVYNVALRHRNHLGVMTAAPVYVGQEMDLLDLSDPTVDAFGADARSLFDGRALLWPGNSRTNDRVAYTGGNNDRDPLLERIGGVLPTAVDQGYHEEDINLDGQVKYTGPANDRDIILNTVGGNVPTAIRNEQLP